jgi:hypothetical protein
MWSKDKVRRTLVLVAATCLVIADSSMAQTPAGFSWVNMESDKATMPLVRQALHDSSMTAIREVGVTEGFALVMTSSREADAPTPDSDRWSIYNVSLKTGASRILVSGWGVKILNWIGTSNDELAITYYDCWECEAATLFTTIRFKTGIGWRARWSDKTDEGSYPHPGAAVASTDLVDGDTEFDLVFGLIAKPDGSFFAGSWEQSRDSKTGKVENDVKRYSIDPNTNEDRVEKLAGRAASELEHLICTPSDKLIQPSSGQDSEACKRILTKPAAHPHS